MVFCKTCRSFANDRDALSAKRCFACGGTEYILPGISGLDLSEYFANRGRWNDAKAALLSADLDPVTLNQKYGELMDKRECVIWVERMELFALPISKLYQAIADRYDEQLAGWYCNDYLGGYDQRWQQVSANAKANGPTG